MDRPRLLEVDSSPNRQALLLLLEVRSISLPALLRLQDLCLGNLPQPLFLRTVCLPTLKEVHSSLPRPLPQQTILSVPSHRPAHSSLTIPVLPLISSEADQLLLQLNPPTQTSCLLLFSMHQLSRRFSFLLLALPSDRQLP